MIYPDDDFLHPIDDAEHAKWERTALISAAVVAAIALLGAWLLS